MMTVPDYRLPTVREAFHLILLTFGLYLVFLMISGSFESKLRLLVLELAIVAPVVFFVRYRGYSSRAVFRWRPVPIRLWMLGIPIGTGLFILTDELNRLIQARIPMQKEILDGLLRDLIAQSRAEAILLFLSVVLVAGLGEEMVFRGFLQGVLERTGNATRAILSAALIFAFLHFNPWWLIEIFILGVLTGVMAWRSASIFPGAAVHMTTNGIALLFLNLHPDRLEWFQPDSLIHPIRIGVAFVMVTGAFLLFWRWTGKESG
ncbi:MAG TPA: CPBP family intramembrane metalloprotease [bacterium]|nr:CPBP family intramembrane metalloprotease [bacterium]